MRASWLVAIAAGMAIGAAPADVAAQGKSSRARQQQEMQRQRQQARQEARREAERKQRASEEARERRERANRSGLVLRRNDEYDRRRNDEYERRRRDRDRRDDRYDDPWDIFGRDDDRYDRRDDRYNNRGPAFCRSGEGHPVHGRQWCRDKGFGLGRDRARDIWGDIIYRDRRYDDRRMGRSTLENILGSVVLGRFDSYGRSYYGNQSLNGRWLDRGASVLQLYMGSIPIARLIDTNRDGRVDNVSLLR